MAKSILSNEKHCFICGSHAWIEKHHIFGAADRKKSEKYGLWVYLCHYCHNEPPNGVHHNKDNMRWLQAQGQTAFEREYPDKSFLEKFGRNYL